MGRRIERTEPTGPDYQALGAGKPMAACDHLNSLYLYLDDQHFLV